MEGAYALRMSRQERRGVLEEKTVRQLIRKYDIAYIYIGQLERQKYPDLNDEMLQKIGKVAYSDGETTYIMRVK